MTRAAALRLNAVTLTLVALAILVRLIRHGYRDTVTAALLCAGTALLCTALATPLAIAVGRMQFASRTLVYSLVVFASATPPMLLAQTNPLPKASTGLAIGIPIAFWTVYLLARALPRGIEDACQLDGASPAKVLLPALRPALTTAAAMVFLFCWFDLAP